MHDRFSELLRLQAAVDAEVDRLAKLQLSEGTEPRRRRSRHTQPDCGTDGGYHAHRYRGEPACDQCKVAHAAHNRVQYAARKKGS